MTVREGDHGALGRDEASGIDTKKVEEVCSARQGEQNLRATMGSKAAIDEKAGRVRWGWEEPGKSMRAAGRGSSPAASGLAKIPA